jgi:hypothetical protein
MGMYIRVHVAVHLEITSHQIMMFILNGGHKDAAGTVAVKYSLPPISSHLTVLGAITCTFYVVSAEGVAC